jgi:vesicle coat complex subunit
MFEGLKWKPAARRSAVVIAIYLCLLYLLSVLFPESNFNLETRAQVISLFFNAALFFLIFTFIYALLNRSRERRMAEAAKQKKPGKPDQGEGDPDASSLRGRPNPNTSRRKSRRRR